VLGHARSRNAISGGKAKHDTIDAQQIAVLRRGGMLPQAYGYPAAMRATRDLLRRRMHLLRKRAALLAHIQKTNRQDHLPAIGTKLACKANRDGGAERFPDPAGQKSIDGDLALIEHDDHLRRDVELCVLKTAQQHDAHPRYLLRPVPGIGELLSLVLRYEIPDIQRCPRGHAFVSSCRFVKCAKASAGKRYGTSGTKRGKAYRTWAFSEAAVRFWRAHPAGQKYHTRLEKKPSKAKALTVLAHHLARAVYDMVPRNTAFDLPTFLRGYGREADEPDASRATRGISLPRARWNARYTASVNAQEPLGSSPRSRRVDWTPAAAP
jgi:transposase